MRRPQRGRPQRRHNSLEVEGRALQKGWDPPRLTRHPWREVGAATGLAWQSLHRRVWRQEATCVHALARGTSR
jgi:hypothetical protein